MDEAEEAEKVEEKASMEKGIILRRSMRKPQKMKKAPLEMRPVSKNMAIT